MSAANIGIGHNGGPPLKFARPKLWLPTFEPWRLLKPLLMDGQWFPKQAVQFEGKGLPILPGYPTILGVSGNNRGSSRNTSSSVALPAGSVSGDRTIIAFSTENAASITTPGSWNDIGVQTSFGTYRYKVFYADSIGAGPVTVGHSNARASWVCIRLGNVHASAPETTTSVVGTDVYPDGPSVTASWGAASNLALSIAAFGLGTISGQTFSASPAGYTTEVTELGASGSSGTVMRIASLQTPLATENPGAFSIGGATNWVADTILIRGA